MQHFVEDDVFEAFARLFSQIGVQTDAARGAVAAAPAGLHVLYKQALHSYPNEGFPLRNQTRCGSLNLTGRNQSALCRKVGTVSRPGPVRYEGGAVVAI